MSQFGATRDAEDVEAHHGTLPVPILNEKYDDVKEKSSLDDEKDAELGGGASAKIQGPDVVEAKGSDDDPDYASLPQIVRELVDFEDDEDAPVLTWRFFVLSTIFTALGAWLQQMGFFRTTYVPYSIYFVQIASLYVGRLMAASLPHKIIGKGYFSLNLNPGPFSVKEHVAIVLAANTGGTNNLGDYVLAPLDVFYGTPMNGWIAIVFMISAVFLGFSLASFARVFLIENPVTLFPLTLQQVSVFKAMRTSFETDSSVAKKQMKVFWWCILAVFLYQTLPEYAAPFLSSLAFLCWVTSNPTAVFLNSGLGGAGILNITLDWSNIGSGFIYYPYWTLVNVFVASVLGAWILYPIGYLTGAWDSDKYPIQSQTLRLANGSAYPTAALLNADYTLNQELFDEIGPPRMSAMLRWAYFFSYVAYVGAFLSCALFQGPQIVRSFKSAVQGKTIHNNILTKMIRKYPQVPVWWNLAIFFGSFFALLGLVLKKDILYMPIYSYFVGLVFGILIVIPMGYIYAISGYSVPVGYFNELFYGYLIDLGGSRHPVGSLSYRVISGQCWYEAQAMLSDMKLGYYFHIPPRATLLAQIWGICVGVPVNYATILWVCNTKRGYLSGEIPDPNHQWTGQVVISLNNQGIAFGLVGPKKLFSDPMYKPLPYGFLVGAGLSLLGFAGHKLTKGRVPFEKFNVAIFGTTMENFYGNISTGFLMTFIFGTINHLYVKKYHYVWWKKYAYLGGAAFDTGFNLNMLFLFVAFSAFKVITMPNYFFNNADSVERCFPSS